MKQHSIRQNKVSRLIQKELGYFFQKETGNLFPGTIISVTVVRVSPDLSIAKVYLSIFSTTSKKEIFNEIKNKTGLIRHELAKKIRNQVKRIPEIIFYEDDSLDYYDNIEKLLNDK
ncbi:MAG: 30S ribosome-binding factor RbfA [Marinilabiliales bacterium]